MKTVTEKQSILDVHQQFTKRWSPRMFSKQAISHTVLTRIIEAARWTPSCYNEQPWLIYTSDNTNKATYVACLDAFNQQWAQSADVIGFIVAHTRFEKNARINHYASFDCGAAWMSMTLQALQDNVYMRAMGGIDKTAVAKCLNLSEQQHVLIGFVMGYPDHTSANHEFNDIENSLNRKPLTDIWKTHTA